MKYALMGLIALCLIAVAVLTLAGVFHLLGHPGIRPEFAIVGIIFAALVGGAASIGVDGQERSF